MSDPDSDVLRIADPAEPAEMELVRDVINMIHAKRGPGDAAVTIRLGLRVMARASAMIVQTAPTVEGRAAVRGSFMAYFRTCCRQFNPTMKDTP